MLVLSKYCFHSSTYSAVNCCRRKCYIDFIVTLPEFRETDVSFKLFIYLVVCCFFESVCCVCFVVGSFVGIIMNYVYHY